MSNPPLWTEAEDAVLRREYSTKGAAACKPELPKRTDSAIRKRATKLGLSSPSGRQNTKPESAYADTDAKERRCLKCREVFLSEWAGARICPRCKKSRQVLVHMAEPVSSGQRVMRRGFGP